MRHLFLFSLVVLVGVLTCGCGDFANALRADVKPPKNGGPNPNNLPNPNTVPKPGAAPGYTVNHSPVVFSELLVDPMGPDAGNQFVEILNTASMNSDIGGWVISDGNATFTFPFGFQIGANSRVVVRLAASGSATPAMQFAASFSVLPQTQGSIALLRGGNEVVDFLQWGGSPNSYESAASSSQVWPSGDFVNLGAEGTSLNLIGGTPGASAWVRGPVTPGN